MSHILISYVPYPFYNLKYDQSILYVYYKALIFFIDIIDVLLILDESREQPYIDGILTQSISASCKLDIQDIRSSDCWEKGLNKKEHSESSTKNNYGSKLNFSYSFILSELF